MSTPAARAAATRLAVFTALYFASLGLMTTYWPAWLGSHGLDAVAIGVLLGASQWAKIPGTLLAGAAARWWHPIKLIALITLLATVIMSLYGLVSGFAALLVLAILWGLIWPSALPLTDSLILASAAHHRFAYGRVRLWGSVSYMAVAASVGWMVSWLGIGALQSVVLGVCAAAFLAALFLPAESVASSKARPGAMRGLLGRRSFWLFMAGTGLAQMSHAVFYGFSTIAWREQGIADGAIGLLWALGVLAEIGLFAVSARIFARIGVIGMLALGAAGGLLRWSATALSPDLGVLAALQLLHALSFGASHLGAMQFMARTTPPSDLPAAQALFYALPMGIGTGLAALLAGYLFEKVGVQAYWAMAVMSALSLATYVILARHWRAPASG